MLDRIYIPLTPLDLHLLMAKVHFQGNIHAMSTMVTFIAAKSLHSPFHWLKPEGRDDSFVTLWSNQLAIHILKGYVRE